MGPRHGALFSIFRRHRQIAVDTVRENVRRVVATALRRRAECQRSGGASTQRGDYNKLHGSRVLRSAHWFNCPSLIERAFPLHCLGNNAFKYLAKSRGENDNR